MPYQYTWHSILGIVREHKKDLISAHIVAILAAVASVPIPLLMPLLVDEVLLHQPGRLVGWLNSQFPTAWQGPVLYISAVLALTLALRLTALILGVWQGRSFTLIAKDVIFRMREQMLLRLSRIAMSEYETLGSAAVASHFVKDLDAMDTFIGASVFLRNRTTLIIAHRLSAVKQADRAYVFDGGQIIEEGMHDELIKGDGLYSRLYGQLQH